MKALILAAGYALRLYPITKERPKALLLIRDRPIINHIIDKISSIEEINEIIVITNSKFISQFEKWKEEVLCNKNIRLVDDLTKNHNDRLGAIGDIRFAIENAQIDDDLLVIGGDNLFDGDLRDFLAFAKTNKDNPVIGVFDLKDKEQAKKYGVLKLDEDNVITDFKEKPKDPDSALVAMCLYLFPKNKLRLIKDYLSGNAEKYDATGYYIDWLRKKETVYGFVFRGRWYDIGDHGFYKEAKEKF